MTILVFGRSGQVGHALAQMAGVRCLARDEADLGDPAACGAAIRAVRPVAVINAAAYTNVDKAEEQEGLATRINGEAPGVMAQVCAGLEIPFVSISSDYVFDGAGRVPWKPEDATGPLGAYGRSKLVGEQTIAAAGGDWAVVRTSWVVSARGSNFVRTMLRLGAERAGLGIVEDQIGGPTPARALAAVCLQVAQTLISEPEKRGFYHYAGTPNVSWAEFAREIFRQSGIVCDVRDIASAEYPTPAKRPLNSRLDCRAIETGFGVERPDWRRGLADILQELGEV
ncbi:MAG: dTDP-4-dehydrorhamnose reductase [Rhodobacteraceae bacterium]|nr:MAG: dTDP-4-dehydrorhamnose reductase [Paracoccaceae bacterium]